MNKDKRIERLEKQLAKKDAVISELEKENSELEAKIAELTERIEKTAELAKRVTEYEATLRQEIELAKDLQNQYREARNSVLEIKKNFKSDIDLAMKTAKG